MKYLIALSILCSLLLTGCAEKHAEAPKPAVKLAEKPAQPPALEEPLPYSAARECALPQEMEALNVRIIQTEIMLTALSCNEKARYNQAVVRFKPLFAEQADNLRAYFSRIYRGYSKKELNNFVTRLANDASKRSLGVPHYSFCQQGQALLTQLLNANEDEFVHLAAKRRYSSLHNVLPCVPKERVAAKKVIKAEFRTQ